MALYGRTKPERCYASQEDAHAAAVDEEDAETSSRSARRFRGVCWRTFLVTLGLVSASDRRHRRVALNPRRLDSLTPSWDVGCIAAEPRH